MRKNTVIALSIIFLIVAVSMSHAGLRKPGLNGAAFLKIGVGARMSAIGGAATTLSGDPYALFWNPAGSVLEGGKTQLGFSYNDWIADIGRSVGVVSKGFGELGTFSVGLIYQGLSDIPALRDIAPVGMESSQVDQATGDSYNYYDMAVVLGYSKQLTDRFQLGVAAKYIAEKIDDQSASAVAFDFGVMYRTEFRDFTIGARMNNLGSDIKYYSIPAPLPLSFSIGTSMSIANEENNQLIAYFDLFKPQDQAQLYFGGAEWILFNRLALRTGYKFNYQGVLDDDNVSQTDEGATFGCGLNLNVSNFSLWLDYTFTDFQLMQNTHRFSLKFEL